MADQGEFEVAALQPLPRIAFGQPVAAIPELDRAATILVFRDGALEIAVVQRMILDLDGEALDAGIERRPLGHRP